MNDTRWLYCPHCGCKTRIMVREHTVLEDFPLFCPKCRYGCIVCFRNGKLEETGGSCEKNSGGTAAPAWQRTPVQSGTLSEEYMEIKKNVLTTDIFLTLYSSAGWEPPCRAQIECALAHTTANFVAYNGNLPVGMVRLIGDGGMSFYIKDFAVLPVYRHAGIGTELLTAVQRYILDSVRPGWAVSLELISTQEAVAFYKKHGFEERPCAWDGPGMFKMLRSGS